MTETGVSGYFSAAHRQYGGGPLHGHTWTVTAWFPDHGVDAEGLQGLLQGVLGLLDHTELPDKLSRGEDLATFIGERLPRCSEVLVSRPAEGFHARWRA